MGILHNGLKREKKNSSEILQNKPARRMLLLLELDNVSSSGKADSFGSNLATSSVRGVLVFVGSVSELLAVPLHFFGL